MFAQRNPQYPEDGIYAQQYAAQRTPERGMQAGTWRQQQPSPPGSILRSMAEATSVSEEQLRLELAER